MTIPDNVKIIRNHKRPGVLRKVQQHPLTYKQPEITVKFRHTHGPVEKRLHRHDIEDGLSAEGPIVE